MSAITLIELLREGERFHRDLAAYYARAEHLAQHDDLRHALERMREHEIVLARTLQALEGEMTPGVVNTWHETPPHAEVAEAIRKAQITPDMSPEEAVEVAQRLDESLIQLYAHLHALSPPYEARQAIARILEVEKAAKKRLPREVEGEQ
jgi:hypothetical protein